MMQVPDKIPTVLLTGLPQVGKTAISRLVFQRASPHELFDRPTEIPEFHDLLPCNYDPSCEVPGWSSNARVVELPHRCTLEDWELSEAEKAQLLAECPAHLEQYPQQFQEFASHRTFADHLARCSSVVVVLDAQDEPLSRHNASTDPTRNPILNLVRIIHLVMQQQRPIPISVFIHKADGSVFSNRSEKAFARQDLHARVQKLVAELYPSIPAEHVAGRVGYALSSVYEYSTHAAMSRVLSNIVPGHAAMAALLRCLQANSSLVRSAFLAHVMTKLHLAGPDGPVEEVGVASDFMDLVFDAKQVFVRPSVALAGDGAVASEPSGLRSGSRERAKQLSEHSRVVLEDGTVMVHVAISENFSLCLICHEESQNEAAVLHNAHQFKETLFKLWDSIECPPSSHE